MQVNYVQAFPQAPIDKDLYLKVPTCLQVGYGDNNDYTLNLQSHLYVKK